MDRLSQRISGMLLCICVGVVGCSKAAPGDEAAHATNAIATQSAPPTDPAARAAYDFFAAVLAGDSQRASAQLTPQAIEGFVDRNEQFAPPGVENTLGFRVGRVVRPAEGVALVQCISSEAAAGEQPSDKEVCVLLRMVGEQWRVSGFAHETGPNQPMMLFNYETGQYAAIPAARAATSPAASQSDAEPLVPVTDSTGQPTTPAAAGRPSPPRNANEAGAPSFR